jgi:hypothetical protein
MADQIKNLPSSQDKPSDIDVNVMQDVFGDGATVVKSLQLKKIIIPVVLFIVLSLPMVNNFIGTVVPDSEFILMFVKTLIFLAVLAILQLMST